MPVKRHHHVKFPRLFLTNCLLLAISPKCDATSACSLVFSSIINQSISLISSLSLNSLQLKYFLWRQIWLYSQESYCFLCEVVWLWLVYFSVCFLFMALSAFLETFCFIQVSHLCTSQCR